MLAGCSGTSGSGGGSSSDDHFVAGTGISGTVPVGQRSKPLDISGKTLDGTELNLASYRGKVLVINIWGSWCAPCRAEASGLEQVYKANAAKGVEFVGIDTRDLQTAAAKAFVKSHKLTYPDLYDPDGELLLKFPKGSLNVQAIPTTIILDREGRIAARAIQALTSDQLTKLLDPVVAEKS